MLINFSMLLTLCCFFYGNYIRFCVFSSNTCFFTCCFIYGACVVSSMMHVLFYLWCVCCFIYGACVVLCIVMFIFYGACLFSMVHVLFCFEPF